MLIIDRMKNSLNLTTYIPSLWKPNEQKYSLKAFCRIPLSTEHKEKVYVLLIHLDRCRITTWMIESDQRYTLCKNKIGYYSLISHYVYRRYTGLWDKIRNNGRNIDTNKCYTGKNLKNLSCRYDISLGNLINIDL